MFLSQTVYYAVTCPEGTTPDYTGAPSAWISLVGNQFVGAAGAYSGVTQVAANEAAQAALNSFVANAFALGQFVCQPFVGNEEVTVSFDCLEDETATFTGVLPDWITIGAPPVPINPKTQAIVDRACGELVGTIEELNTLIDGLDVAGVYDKIYAMWTPHKMVLAASGGAETLCDHASAISKPTDEFWDLGIWSLIGFPAPVANNVLAADPDFNNRPSVLLGYMGPIGFANTFYYYRTASTQVINQPFEVFAVAIPDPEVTGVPTGPATEVRFRILWDDNVRSHVNWDEEDAGFYQYSGSVGTRINPGAAVANEPAVFHSIHDGASSVLTHYASVTTTTGAENVGAAGFGGSAFRLGQLNNLSPQTSSYRFSCILFTPTLSAPERTAVVALLRSIYGI
ncbi:MAG: hypothetical protein ACOYD4_03920 [Solirubrobacterales bacterium]